MLELFTVILLLIGWLLFRLLNLRDQEEKPRVLYKDPCSPFIQNLLESCPSLLSVYHPTFLWGRSGHIQTIVHAKMGRTKPKRPNSRRVHIVMEDGATMSYDVFEADESGTEYKAKFTLAICPGISNSSECIYLRTFSSYAKSHGYRVAVLNHLGALKSEPVTSPRIFTYGGTDEYKQMIDDLKAQYPGTEILAVGFSMGANIVCKYLGEDPANQRKVLCAMSICQGYEVNDTRNLLLKWNKLRRFYAFAMTVNKRRLMKRHDKILFGEEAVKRYGEFDTRKVYSATSLCQIDINYSHIRAGFKDVESYYRYSSCAYYIHNIKIPMFIMNAMDDPICPEDLFVHPRKYTENSENALFVVTKHGGHLGFYEGGFLVPNDVTWLDRVVVEYADAITSLYLERKLPNQAGIQTCLVNSPDHNEDQTVSTDTTEIAGDQHEPVLSKHCELGDDVSPKNKSENKKRGSLKKGAILQKATSYVQ